MGAPGLASETWDPRNQCSMDTRDVTTGWRIPSTMRQKQPQKETEKSGTPSTIRSFSDGTTEVQSKQLSRSARSFFAERN
jgi:hypothetical protein